MAVAIIVPAGHSGGSYQIVGATASATATTFDAAHNTNFTLSNGDLTATYLAGGNQNASIYSIAQTTANQKVYLEITLVQVTFNGTVGFANINTVTSRFLGASVSPSTGFILATNGNFSCLDSADNATALIASWTTADLIDLALDTGTSKFWARKNNGAWNATIGGSQDPATGTGGVTVSPVSGPFYFGCGLDASNNDAFTARFSSASWAHTAPSGFTQLA